ncbi:MAG: TonB-dependent receptor [Pseudomonadota bacterium]
MKRLQFSVMLLYSCMALSVHAGEQTSDFDYFEEFPLVLSASRLAQPLSEAPNAMTVIDREMIVASGSRNIADLLKLVPGMYVSYYKGSQGFAAYHGATDQYARRMQVLIDGRSVYLPPLSTVDWADLPLSVEDIERIEVVRGPAAASYGANSTQGVISIVTRDADSVKGKQLSYTHGTHGINDVAARFGGGADAYDYRVTLAYKADNGYTDLSQLPAHVPVTLFNQNALLRNNNDSNQARMLNYRGNYHPDAQNSVDLQFGFSRDVQGVGFVDKNPSSVNPYNTNPASTNGNTPHDLFASAHFAQADWIRMLENDSELRLRFYHMHLDRHEAVNVYLGGTYFADPILQSVRSGRDELEVQHTLAWGAENRLVYGAAWRQDQLDAQGVPPASLISILGNGYAHSLKSDELRVFAHDEWHPMQPLLVNVGGMYERDRMGHENVSPRVALNLHFLPRHTLRMGSSVAYRTPAVAEEFFPALQPGDLVVTNPTATSAGLQAERMLSREIGYLGEFSEWGASLDLRLFSDQLSDGIYESKLSGRFVNGMSSELRGMEMTIKYQPGRNATLTLNAAHIQARSNCPALLAAGDTACSTVNPARYNDVLAGSIPVNSVSALYSRNMSRGWSVSSGFYYQDELQPYDRPVVDFQPAQRRVDLRLAKSFHDTGSWQGEAALTVQNLFDTAYTEYTANNVFDRRIFATLTLRW